MKLSSFIIILTASLFTISCNTSIETAVDYTAYTNKFIGTGLEGRISPVASVPFGMMQIAPDTRSFGSGYHYEDSTILGFSHLHKSGGGCADFLDILFLPLHPSVSIQQIGNIDSKEYNAEFNHDDEIASPGYYSVNLYNDSLLVELTASRRCGIQRYQYKDNDIIPVLIDLEYGSQSACTIQPQHDVDTVFASYIEIIDPYTIQGYRISNGWAPNQQIYFYTKLSAPIKDYKLFSENIHLEHAKSAKSENIKLLLSIDNAEKEVVIKTGISAVDINGAKNNLNNEVLNKSFKEIQLEAKKEWNNVLSKIEIETDDPKTKEIFYTSLHNVMHYPMLFSDIDNRFRGPDAQIHETNGYDYYGAVVGLWDTFRAACPLTAMLFPNIMSDYINTALDHYKYAGQLPIWTLAGMETYQMIGIHAMPMITNSYLNGITSFDQEYALEAMVNSAMKDTCGYSMGYFVGLQNYKKYGYVPCDLEMEATARTLEYAYDDHAIARYAEKLGKTDIAKHFYARSKNYHNVIDPETMLARGRKSDGSWNSPFNPLQSEHRRDDYCEGNAWQWTFFVPHDIVGLANIMGSNQALENKLDSLFTMTSSIHGENISGDISGLIGQYAHGNEPGHHTIYMYNKLGAPTKTQKYIHQVLNTLYDNTPEGICGNEDTGQMSAWYVYSSLGLYPMDPVSGQYELGTPSFKKAIIHLPNSKQFIITSNKSSSNQYIVNATYLNDIKLDRTFITFDEVLNGGTLHFEMK